jgi:hypothetical protein
MRSETPIAWIPEHKIPAWVKSIPNWALFFRDTNSGCVDLLTWLGHQGLPRPTLLELESERHRRGGDDRRRPRNQARETAA